MTILKRNIMTLYSDPSDPYSHHARIVLAEKGVSVDVLDVTDEQPSDDLIELNPYQSLPTLVDRDLVLYTSPIIMEYLDERFPHPPLLPAYPVARSRCRLMIYRIERDWFGYYRKICSGDADLANKGRESLKDSLLSLTQIFEQKPYFLSDDYTLVDSYLAPLLWRLTYLGVVIPRSVKSIHQYMDRVFSRDAFQASLSLIEEEMY